MSCQQTERMRQKQSPFVFGDDGRIFIFIFITRYLQSCRISKTDVWTHIRKWTNNKRQR
jgi:hypothetical protein